MNDQGNGLGTYFYNRGDIYYGEWKNGLRHGNGKLVKQDGTEEVGQWESGNYIGHAKRHKDKNCNIF